MSFQSPSRTARERNAGPVQYNGRGASAAFSASTGQTLTPSHLGISRGVCRANAQQVGIQSVISRGVWHFPAGSVPGQLTIVGTRMPPSYRSPFLPRKGELLPVSL